MKYGPDIVNKITEELKKVPTIRHVCNKLGIDHSTFYRWMAKHFKFHQEVEAALAIGRERMNDAAESVILAAIQNSDMRAAMYWLAHNSDRYVGADRAKWFLYLRNDYLNFLRESPPEDEILFENLYQHYFMLENVLGDEVAKLHMDPLVRFHCHIDENLVEIFYASYAEWKKSAVGLREKRGNLMVPPKEILDIINTENMSEVDKAEYFRNQQDTNSSL